MELKTCPNCGAEVPTVASRCKHCFHDFATRSSRGFPILGAVGMFAVMMMIAAGTFYYRYSSQTQERVVVDEETKSVVFTRTSGEGIKTSRVAFTDIGKIKHVIGGDKYMFEVIAVTLDGRELLLKQSESDSLGNDAQHYASMMGKPFEEINNNTNVKSTQ